MSGYTPKKMQTAKLITQPANMMMAGLAPRIGKSGASIRLYYQRVDGCCDFCATEPIKILKRGIFTGDLVSGSWNSVGNASLNVTSDITTAGVPPPRKRNAYYVIVFNRPLTSPIAISPPGGASLDLATATRVDWVTGIVAASTLYEKTIPDTDFQLLDFGGPASPAPNNTNIGEDSSGWHIFLDGSTVTSAGPGSIPAADLGGGWRGNSVNYNIATGGLNVGVSTGVANMAPNFGCLAYLITNASHFGGAAIIFNISRLLNASRDVVFPPVPATWDSITLANTITKNGYRQGLANITWFIPPPATSNRNNIGVAYSSNLKSVLYSQDNCGFLGPIANFNIDVGESGIPELELIDSSTW
jgi:hypothetical protein